MTADSEDEYAMYDDYSNFTEEELAQIDSFVAARDQTRCTTTTTTIVETNNDPSKSPGIPHVQIELEDAEPAAESLPSPLQLFRSTKILSVTDISSPAWCEVQFDYGLRQMRHRKLKDRPASFVTEKGKEIFVDTDTAASSDKVKRKGVSVHKKLEREIRPEEIKVTVSTEEERWGLRLINMIDCIDSLLLLGCAREIPVFGLVQGHAVVGIIDEILFSSLPHNNKKRGFQSSPSSPQKPKRIRRSPSPSQSKITSFMSFDEKSATTETSSSSSDAPTPCITPTLHLIDTKTRRSNSLPRDEDTFSSRIQLMLYYRMLTDLMSTSNALDLPFFWQKLGLDAAAPFSRKFIAQTLLTEETNCLNDLVRFWRVAVSRLMGAKIDSTLQLIYRLQPRFSGHHRNKQQNSSGETASAVSSREELEIARAIQASLCDVQVVPQDDEHRLAEALARSVTDAGIGIEEEKTLAEDPELLWAIEQSLLMHLDQNGQSSSSQNNQSSTVSPPMEEPRAETPQHSDPDIIGTKEFEFDNQVLDDYLTDIMKWWNGARPSRGVSLEQSGRCFSCEYRIGCEWRDQKASEIESEVKDRRKKQLTS